MFAWGKVYSTEDPQHLGRVRVTLTGVFEPYHPQWAIPIGFPYGGSTTRGGQAPVEEGATVAVFFDQDDMAAPPAYLPGWPGELDGFVAGPPMVHELAKKGVDPRDVTTLYDDETFSVHIRRDVKALEIRVKEDDNPEHEGRFVFSAASGASKRALTLDIYARTAIAIKSMGQIEIEGTRVIINGRVVATKPGTSI